MPFLTELDISRSAAIDAANTGNAIRVFDTELQDEQAAKTAFFEEQGTGSYPTDPRLRYDRLQLDRAPRGSGLRVTAFYSTNGAGRFSKSRRPETYSYKWKYGNVRAEVDIPVDIREIRTVKGQSGDVTYEVWVPTKLKIIEYRTAWTLSVYAKVENVLAFETITRQMNKIHLINGTWALFADATVTLDESRRDEGSDPASTENWYRIEYTWVVDRGTPRPNGFAGDNPRYALVLASNPIPDPIPLNDSLIRQPYASPVILPSLDPRNEPSTQLEVRSFAVDANGYRELPGTDGGVR